MASAVLVALLLLGWLLGWFADDVEETEVADPVVIEEPVATDPVITEPAGTVGTEVPAAVE